MVVCYGWMLGVVVVTCVFVYRDYVVDLYVVLWFAVFNCCCLIALWCLLQDGSFHRGLILIDYVVYCLVLWVLGIVDFIMVWISALGFWWFCCLLIWILLCIPDVVFVLRLITGVLGLVILA